jgi:hypothetical protein
MRIPHSGATQPLGPRWGFETTSNQITEKGVLAIKYRPAPFCFQSGESIISLILQIELIAGTIQKGLKD